MWGGPSPSYSPSPVRFTATSSQEDETADPSTTPARGRPLEKTLWLTLHPVIKWTMLVDVARRAPYLLDKPVLDKKQNKASNTVTDGTTDADEKVEEAAASRSVLAHKDPQVHFSAAATAQHARLCAALPYASRLLLTLSLLLWLRSLRDTQDTLSRVRLPYAPTERLRHLVIAHVFPTRLQEYWCDHYTTVVARMDPTLNSTAEQIPAPHAWDPATSETVEDSVTESTLVLQGHRGKGLLGGMAREDVLRQIQGTVARPSDEDGLAARITGSRTRGGRDRRRLAVAKARERALLSGKKDDAIREFDTTSTRAGATASTPSSSGYTKPGTREHWSRRDSERTVAPVRMDTEHAEDAAYHHNTKRGEGCPLSDDGALDVTPIHITATPPSPPSPPATWSGSGTALPPPHCESLPPPHCESLVKACVMAHAAILSALFIEGRVVAFTTNEPLVRDYVECVFEAWVAERYMTVALVADDEPNTKAGGGGATAPAHRPYFPPWCFKSALAVLPPRPGRRYRHDEVHNLARTIVHAAPCAVMVQGDDATAHVDQLKAAVTAVQDALASAAKQSGDAKLSATRPGGWLGVEWVPVRLGASTRPGSAPSDSAPPESTAASASAKALFRPKGVAASGPAESGSASDSVRRKKNTATSTASWLSPSSWWRWETSAAESSSSSSETSAEDYLTAVAEALEGGEFYTAQVLRIPENCAFTPRQVRQWLLERLPANVRVVGINTSPANVLYFYPQAPFLTGKVGNSFRYRSIDRVLVEKFGAGWASDPIRAGLGRYRWARRGRPWDRVGLHSALALSDRAVCVAREAQARSAAATTTNASPADDDQEDADDALVWERTVEYLANPGKGTLVALIVAKTLGV